MSYYSITQLMTVQWIFPVKHFLYKRFCIKHNPKKLCVLFKKIYLTYICVHTRFLK